MGVEYVKRISIKKNGVYMRIKTNKDIFPYRSHKIETLSKIYKEQGLLALDAEIVRMIDNYGVLIGNHKSILKYKDMWNLTKVQEARKEKTLAIKQLEQCLTKKDRDSEWSGTSTENYKLFTIKLQEIDNIFYKKVAEIINNLN